MAATPELDGSASQTQLGVQEAEYGEVQGSEVEDAIHGLVRAASIQPAIVERLRRQGLLHPYDELTVTDWGFTFRLDSAGYTLNHYSFFRPTEHITLERVELERDEGGVLNRAILCGIPAHPGEIPHPFPKAQVMIDLNHGNPILGRQALAAMAEAFPELAA